MYGRPCSETVKFRSFTLSAGRRWYSFDAYIRGRSRPIRQPDDRGTVKRKKTSQDRVSPTPHRRRGSKRDPRVWLPLTSSVLWPVKCLYPLPGRFIVQRGEELIEDLSDGETLQQSGFLGLWCLGSVPDDSLYVGFSPVELTSSGGDQAETLVAHIVGGPGTGSGWCMAYQIAVARHAARKLRPQEEDASVLSSRY